MDGFNQSRVPGAGLLRLLAVCLTGFPAVIDALPEKPLVLSANGREIMSYNTAYLESPEKDAPWYGRSGFIHPVRSPSGIVVTDDFPVGHRHQHGIMFAWTSAIINGETVDFWNSHKKQGRVEHVETLKADDGEIRVRLRHVDLTAKPPATAILETWKLTAVPHATLNVFDLESVLETEESLKIGEYRYGGLCVRGAAKWAHDAVLLTSDGMGREDGNHSRTSWVAMSGKSDGKTAGIACLGHPSNFRAPQPVRLHPEFPYFSFAPVVLGDFTIKAGKPFVSRYRFVVFDGEPDAELLDRIWRVYAGGKS